MPAGGVSTERPGPGSEGQSWLCCLLGTPAPNPLAGPQPAAGQGFAKAGGSHHNQASTGKCGDSHKRGARNCFQGQLASNSAQSLVSPH